MNKYGKVYNSWKNGSDIYKDKKGFFIIDYNPKKNIEFKKYINYNKKKVLKKSIKKKNIKKKKNKKKKKKKKIKNLKNINWC